jgi:ATP-dependent Zn protease
MINEPITVQEIKEFKLKRGIPDSVPFRQVARTMIAERLKERVENAKQSGSRRAIQELTEVVEFLVDCYEKGCA